MKQFIKFENNTNGRYYYISTYRDLFDAYIIHIARGGNYKRVICRRAYNSQETVEIEIKRLSRLRLQRGYTRVEE